MVLTVQVFYLLNIYLYFINITVIERQRKRKTIIRVLFSQTKNVYLNGYETGNGSMEVNSWIRRTL